MAVIISTASEFHSLITCWLKKYFLLCILNLLHLNFLGSPYFKYYEVGKKEFFVLFSGWLINL